MRTLIAAAGIGLLAGIPVATAGQPDTTPEARAYVNLSFGGAAGAGESLHYGLRLDHDSGYSAGKPLPALFQLDFTRRGLNAAQFNGMNLGSQRYWMAQAEEEGGFFDAIGNWFSNMFGGGDEEEDTYDSGSSMGSDEPATFLGYNAMDWGLLAVGLVGIGYIGSEIANGSESADIQAADGGDEEEENGGLLCDPGFLPGPLAGQCIPDPGLLLTGGSRLSLYAQPDPKRQEWLDAGTGHMGDLGE